MSGLCFRQATAKQSLNLLIDGTDGHDDTVEIPRVARLVEKRNTNNPHLRAHQLESSKSRRDRSVDSRMDDCFEGTSGSFVLENDRPQPLAVDRTAGLKDGWTDPWGNGRRRFSPRRGDTVRQDVGVETWNAEPAKPIENVA